MAQQYLPNTFADMTAALAQGQQFGREREVRKLAPQVVGGDAAAFQQAAAIDPAAATKLGEAGDRIGLQVNNIARQIKAYEDSGKPEQAAYLYQQALPTLKARFPNSPDQYGPDVIRSVEAVIAQTNSVQDKTTPAAFQEFEAKARAAGLTPGSPEYQEAANIALGRLPRAVTGAIKFDTAVDAQGNPRPQRNNPTSGQVEVYQAETNSWVPLGGPVGGGAAPATQQVMQSNGVPVTFGTGDAAIPPEIQAAIAANPDAAAGATSINVGQLPQATLGIGQSKAAEAGASEQAKLQAQLQALPAELQMRTQAGLDLETGKAALKEQEALTEQASESEAKLNQIRDRQTMVTGAIDDALSAPGFDAAFGIDYARGFVPSTDARDARLRVNTVTNQIRLNVLSDLKALSPTGGAVGQVSNEEGRVMEGYLGQLDWTLSDAEARRVMGKIKERMATMSSRLEAAAAKDRAAAQGAYAPATPAGATASDAAGWSIEQVN